MGGTRPGAMEYATAGLPESDLDLPTSTIHPWERSSLSRGIVVPRFMLNRFVTQDSVAFPASFNAA